ncbi:hypothetical protein [Alkaliphilus peptidifermentans]|uniref:Uncharacterized protein n=1 Tax=Alkaliphilus peptidifermentans DSM 18978 TaxID=1120976 RepID=A0A1G5JIG2_9FIRM|nr:hypothetical protein [Alkaliphilus peptidifermentans]SCY87660.1 hypothetical protein SAMN03080606_02861 [Alkaliphilus peptidifermentans DSM 18978]
MTKGNEKGKFTKKKEDIDLQSHQCFVSLKETLIEYDYYKTSDETVNKILKKKTRQNK